MKEVKVFRDPIYGYVKVDEELIWKLIQTKEFQRLRRIHQLGGTYVVYHTAEHSRFSHSLGVYEVARRIIYEVEEIRTSLSKEERLITQCAALLHDIGHGPFSHAFESVFHTIHEEYSIAIILDASTEVNKILESYKKGFSKKVSRVIKKECYKDVCKQNCNHLIMNSLISSQLDADRLDYLQRDAYNTGATYGEIDLERIIRSFLVVDNKIAFKYTSIHTIENYLMSRYHMYWQVYFHPVGISYEIILVNIFKRVKHLVYTEFPFHSDISVLKSFITGDMTIEGYIELDETWMLYKIKEWSKEDDPILHDLCSRYLYRYLFKYINCQTKEILDEKYKKLLMLFKKNNFNTEYYLQKDTIVKEAYQYYNNESLHNDSIMLLLNGKLTEIECLSHIVKGIKDVGAKTDYKIYYAKELVETMNEEDQKIFYNEVNK